MRDNHSRPDNDAIAEADRTALAKLRREHGSCASDHDDLVAEAHAYCLARWDGARPYPAFVAWKAAKLALDAERRAQRATAPAPSGRRVAPLSGEEELLAECRARVGPEVAELLESRTVPHPEWRAWATKLQRAARKAREAIAAVQELYPGLGRNGDLGDRVLDLDALDYWADREIQRYPYPGIGPDAAASILIGERPKIQPGDTAAKAIEREAGNIRRERNKRRR